MQTTAETELRVYEEADKGPQKRRKKPEKGEKGDKPEKGEKPEKGDKPGD